MRAAAAMTFPRPAVAALRMAFDAMKAVQNDTANFLDMAKFALLVVDEHVVLE